MTDNHPPCTRVETICIVIYFLICALVAGLLPQVVIPRTAHAQTANSAAVPGEPCGLLAVGRNGSGSGDGSIVLSWDDPGDSSITGYQYRLKTPGTSGEYGSWIDIPDSGASTTGHTITSLNNHTRYNVNLRAGNAAGWGVRRVYFNAWTTTTFDTTTTHVPKRPVLLSSSFYSGTIAIVWKCPRTQDQVLWYEYQHKIGAGMWSDWITLPPTARSLTLAVLDRDTRHYVVLRARNSNGFGSSTLAFPRVPPPPGFRFSDDDGSIHEGAIEAVAAAGVAPGCQHNLYCPADSMTRAQFASLLVRAFPDLIPEDAENHFSDDDGTVDESAINRLASAGITAGCGPRRYCPDDPMTRAQAATLLARALSGLAPPDRDHFSDDDGTVHEIAINALAENGIVSDCGAGRYCPDDPMRRDQAATLLARALNLEPTQPTPSPWQLEPVADGIDGDPTDLQAPAGDDRLFLATKQGAIRIIADGAQLPEPLLDLTDKVNSETVEEGLLGLAFHPHYATNHKFYVFYTDLDGHNQVYEYRTDPSDPNRADPSTARHIITFHQTCLLHNGGQLQFGADGYLYIAVGDGACFNFGTKPETLDQNPHNILGTIVRIDVDNGDPYSIPADNPFVDGQDGLPEVWAYGLRNPWRFSFDGPNIYIADVGHHEREELNIADVSRGGINYGWPIVSDTQCIDSNSSCAGLFTPQIEYYRNDGFAIIGGYVYRGTAIAEMVGRYFYADYTGWIRTFAYQDGEITEHYDWSQAIEELGQVWSFGKDGHGELYVLTSDAVHKIVPR